MAETSAADGAVTPMMAQYLAIKAEHADALLFYRMGDFYEMFFEDAEAAAAALDIALTRRGQHLGRDIPMCGVPVHSAESYLLTLIRKGFRVAIAEQTEDPAEAKKRGAKSVVAREVVRLVTPGTLTEDNLLDARASNHLAAWAEIRGEGALAWADVSTGELHVAAVPRAELAAAMARVAPREVLIREEAFEDPALGALIAEAGATATPLPASSFDSTAAEARLTGLFGVATLEGFGGFARAEIAALGALASYVELTQRRSLAHLRPPRREPPGGTMAIDAATRRNLELTEALSGGRAGSLLGTIDRTRTGAGSRLLAARITAPLTDPQAIAARLDAVDHLVQEGDLRCAIRTALGHVPEIERALTRLALDRGGPRDLAAIRVGLMGAGEIAARLGPAKALPQALAEVAAALSGHAPLADRLTAALVCDPPVLARDGGFIAEGVDPDLDAARRLSAESRSVIAAMQADYAAETGIASLKIRHNAVLGHFVEVTATHAERMLAPPLAARFIHRQTLASALRFTTPELAEIESRIAGASARALEIERRHFADLTAAVLEARAAVAGAAGALAALDVAAGAAALAVEAGWCRPDVTADRAFRIRAGRHPVVEAALAAAGSPFIANECDLSGGADGPAPIWLVTGPNMAGKSTFLRQNALIAVMAQAGLFVPAAAAEIGVIDRLFSRVGAADDLARGRSTFMVEMVETAAILNQAGPRSLVILDEIGRGTATHDGLAIAWAVLEHLHDANRARGLFATHYHELTALSERLDRLVNATVAVREWEGEVIFLHEIRPGTADRSYGVQVARLAGLPAPVVARARAVLERLERGEREGGRGDPAEGLPLFSAAAHRPPPASVAPASPVETRLRGISPDDLSPREALDLVYALHALLLAEGAIGNG